MKRLIMLVAIVASVVLGFSACAKKSRAQGSFSATECKSVCDKSGCNTRCISADGSFKQILALCNSASIMKTLIAGGLSIIQITLNTANGRVASCFSHIIPCHHQILVALSLVRQMRSSQALLSLEICCGCKRRCKSLDACRFSYAKGFISFPPSRP